jgi:hydrogenase-4 component F
MELTVILSSLLLSALVCLLATRRVVIEVITAAAALSAFVFSVMIAYTVTVTGIYNPNQFFCVDALAAILLLIISLVGLAATLYSIRYLREETNKQIIDFGQVKQYYVLLNLFLAAMIFAATSNNPVFTWISIEATTLSTAFLISFYNKPSAIEAAWKYLVINSIGLLLGFFGTLLFFTSLIGMGETGFTTWSTLLFNAPHFNPTIAKIAFIFVLIGYGTKVGLAPMHTWLPDAHSKAPVPISALLSGVLLNVAFVAILRFKTIVDASVGNLFSQKLLIIFGLISIFMASLIIFTQKNYKRLLAYSSIENMGFIAIGFGFGGLGIFAALLHMIYHSLVKSSLFMMAGNIFLRFSSTKISSVRGLIKTLPITSILFLIGLFAITGTPPFGLFFTKLYILSAGIHAHPIATTVAIFSAALLFIGFLRHIIAMTFGNKPGEITAGEKNSLLTTIPLILLAIAFYISFHKPLFLSGLLAEAMIR